MSKLYIKAGRFLDGTGAAPKQNVAITVEDGKIATIGPIGQAPQGAEVYDFTAKTVMPGMINCHIHIDMEPSADPMNAPHNVLEKVLACIKNAGAYIDTGVTYVRTLGSEKHYDLQLRDAIRAGKVRGPGMIAAGRKSKCFSTISAISLSESFPVPKVSTMMETGFATPIA